MPKTRPIEAAIATIKEHRPDLVELATTMLAGGHTEAETIRMVVAQVDALIDWVAIGATVGPVGAAVGGIVELVDGPVAIALVKPILRAARALATKKHA